MMSMNSISRFIKKENKVFNIYHPEIRDKIEYAFTLNSVKYYRYKESHLTKVIRYKYQIQFLNEYELGITYEDLINYIDELEKHINKGQLGDIAIKLRLIKQRAQIYKDFDLFYKIASAYYFDENEDVTTYDFRYNKKKIKEFKETKDLSFFLTKPLINLFPSLTSLTEDLSYFLTMAEEAREMKTEIGTLILGQ